MIPVYIILVNYNGYLDTIECVKSLNNIKNVNYRIIIVDNASTDNSVDMLRKNDLCQDCIIIESEKNLGFSGGNNLGIQLALDQGAKYILLLNNDTIVDPNFLHYMLSTFEKDNEIGVVGCKINYYPETNKIWYGGGYINWFKFIGEHIGTKEEDNGKYDKEKEIDFMTGCCMLIKREVFETVGLLTEEYFMYFEDVDFCVNVRNYGFKIWYNPKAVIYHKVGYSSGGEESPFFIKWTTKNRIKFMRKYKSKVSKFSYFRSNLFLYSTRIIKLIKYVLAGDINKAKALISGIMEGLKEHI